MNTNTTVKIEVELRDVNLLSLAVHVVTAQPDDWLAARPHCLERLARIGALLDQQYVDFLGQPGQPVDAPVVTLAQMRAAVS